MKSIFLIVFLYNFAIGLHAQSNIQVYFIANDSINISEGAMFSRAIVISKSQINRPSYVEVFLDSNISNFGYIQIEKFDTVRRIFSRIKSKIITDKVIENTDFTLLRANKFELKFKLIYTVLLNSGLYRARVKFFISRYNRNMSDIISNWSYFTWGNSIN